MIGNSNSNIQIENLKSENIRKHVTILGVTGTYSSIPDAVDSGVFWTNPDDDGYYQDCEYVNWNESTLLIMDASVANTNKRKKVKRLKLTNCSDVTSLQRGFADNNTFLVEVDLYDSGITTFGDSSSCKVFYGCENLISIKLPRNLERINSSYAIIDTSITEIVLPASLTSIGKGALYRNRSLQRVDCTALTYSNGTPNTTIEKEFIQDSLNAILVFADEATMNVYAQATNWSTWASRMTYEGAE